MKLITKEQEKKLLKNWSREPSESKPVLKLFSPAGAATWLIHSMDPEEKDHLFGLCDLGMGFPELGNVSLSELQEVKIPVRVRINNKVMEHHMSIERYIHFNPQATLSVYAEAARNTGRITEMTADLQAAGRDRARAGTK